jgi:hypothetical protein
VRSDCHGRWFFGDVLWNTPPFEKARTGRTDEVEQRHPHEKQGDDGDGDDDGNDFVRHNFLRDLTVEAVEDEAASAERRAPESRQIFGSESIVRLGEIVLIRGQGPVVVSSDGMLRHEQYGTDCDCSLCRCGLALRRCATGARRGARAWACG